MFEVKNKSRSPVQLLIRSFNQEFMRANRTTKAFTTLVIPGIGKGHNVRLIEDERYTPYWERLEQRGLISIRRISEKGDK